MKKQDYPKVTIIFPNYNGGQEPLDCLKSIKNLAYPQEKIETIVIDNNSSDGSFETIKKKFKSVRLIKNAQNLGYAKAINQGIKLGKSPYYLLTNDDIIFERNSLRVMIDFMLANHHVGIIGAKVYHKSSPNKVASAGYQMNSWTGNITSSVNVNKAHEVQWVPGCALLIGNNVVKKIGVLDDKFSFSFEDVDLCKRAREKGFQVIYLPKAIFWHGESTTANKNRYRKHYQWYQSKIRYAIKNLPPQNIFTILILQIFYVLIKETKSHDDRIIPFSKALLWNIKNLKKTLKNRPKK